MNQMLRDCSISSCGKYRYTLTRIWNPSPHPALLGVTALNPSTADAEIDDPSVLKLISFGRVWNFDGYLLTNLWPLRATNPNRLFAYKGDIISEGTADFLIHCFREANITEVLCCWGTHAKTTCRKQIHTRGHAFQKAFLSAGLKLLCLGRNQDGTSKHPLYLPPTLKPQPYSPENHGHFSPNTHVNHLTPDHHFAGHSNSDHGR